MTDIDKLNAEIAGHTEEIARLTAERDALEKPVSDAERWARAYRKYLCEQRDWCSFSALNSEDQTDLIAAMQPVIDGIRAEADCALVAMTAERDAMREELATLRRLYSEDSRSLSNKWAAAISERVEAERDEMTISAHMRELGFVEAHPADVPSVGELALEYETAKTGCDGGPLARGDAGITAVLAHLRPWLRPRTITRDQLDAAARVITTQRVVDENSTLADTARGITQDVFAAVGITVEDELL